MLHTKKNSYAGKTLLSIRTLRPFETGAVQAPPPPVIENALKGRTRPPPGVRKGSSELVVPPKPLLSSPSSLPLSLLPPSTINPPVQPGVIGPSNGPPARRTETSQPPSRLTTVNKFLRELRHQMFSPRDTDGDSDAPDSAIENNHTPACNNPGVSPQSVSDIPSFLSEDFGIPEWWTPSPLSDSLPSSSSADNSEAQSIITELQDSVYSTDDEPGMPQGGASNTPNIPGILNGRGGLAIRSSGHFAHEAARKCRF
ncbi:uncharacterized protein LOC135927217 [Gordionus sp. m RMFG-2023]|uniref:uncharacterized protein LOC135927217 n=1 Tax=Gordionus sp. m RMFG-2023 TaxID=3053472 RepID=UPI0031FBC1A9